MEGCPGGCPCPNWDCDAAVPSQVGRNRQQSRENNFTFSVMISMTMMISIDVKTVSLKNSNNVLMDVVVFHLVSFHVQQTTKMV